MKTQVHTFNNLLSRYRKCIRKRENLMLANRNHRRQGILGKQIERLYQKLTSLFISLKRGTIVVAAIGGAMAFQPNEATAQVSFGAVQTNPFSLTDIGFWSAPAFADLDNDGDFDLLSGDQNGGFNYFENTGTASVPSFGSVQSNPFSLTTIGGASSITFGDLDNDGDIDLMSVEMSGTWHYFENTGTVSAPTYGAAQTNPFSLTDIGMAYNPSFGDLDNDGDLDLMVGEYFGSFYYFENTGTVSSPSYGGAQTNPFSLTNNGSSLSSPELGDLDNDGDLDLITGENSGSGDIHYYENTGTASAPTFGAFQTNPFSLTALSTNVLETAFADLDGDGDLDLTVGNSSGDFRYFENTSPTDIHEYDSPGMNIYPNPTSGTVNVSINAEQDGSVDYTVSTIDGKIVKQEQKVTGNIITIDLSNESKGLYLLRIDGLKSANIYKISKQ